MSVHQTEISQQLLAGLMRCLIKIKIKKSFMKARECDPRGLMSVICLIQGENTSRYMYSCKMMIAELDVCCCCVCLNKDLSPCVTAARRPGRECISVSV